MALLFLIGTVGSIVAPVENEDDTSTSAPAASSPPVPEKTEQEKKEPAKSEEPEPATKSPEPKATTWPDNGAPFPPEPAAEHWAAFINGLETIDPDIVHGKEEKAVDRGRNQCTSNRDNPNDEAKLIELTNARFTSPNHPDGFGEAKSTRILQLVRDHICPSA
ncbi:hypothetical protein [Streptomyces barkulensis]|uniref:hypothetical protein n=1 Tax=Streptomyces barkulensis TaxID=1257026 RepID=UPI000C6EFC70|nr:hypothetical protein [Streptomyces barkulensis]